MSVLRPRMGHLVLASAIALLAACQDAPKQATAPELSVEASQARLGARTFRFRTPGGAPVTAVSVLIGGQRVDLAKGGVPKELAKLAATKGAVLLADGFLPIRLEPGAGDVYLIRVPISALGKGTGVGTA